MASPRQKRKGKNIVQTVLGLLLCIGEAGQPLLCGDEWVSQGCRTLSNGMLDGVRDLSVKDRTYDVAELRLAARRWDERESYVLMRSIRACYSGAPQMICSSPRRR